jgi:non-ribosomal peptide synthetase component F
LVVEWNQTQHDWAQDLCIHQQVAAWAARAPAAVAVASPERQLTYAELEQRANQLAHYLRQLGVGAEDVVAVCLERSVELIVAWLAILKAGGAYLPLDPAYPSERLNYLLADAEAAVVITCQALGARLQAPRARLLCLDQEGGPIAQAPTTAPEVPVLPAQLAYIIYTSGSTGTPKGVLVPHQGLINLVAWHHHAFALTQASRTTQLAGVAFDAATWEVWASLSAGATLYLAPPELVASPARLQAWLLAQAITLTFLPTPLAEAVLQLPWPAEAALRTLLTGGDTLHPRPRCPFRSSTTTDPPKTAWSPPPPASPYRRTPSGRPPSAGPLPTSRCICSTGICGRCRSGSPGSSTWAERAWPVVIRTVPP